MTNLDDENPSIYDNIGIHRYLERHRNDEAKKEYIDDEIQRMNDMEDGISLYDLNQVAEISKIYKEADKRFGS